MHAKSLRQDAGDSRQDGGAPPAAVGRRPAVFLKNEAPRFSMPRWLRSSDTPNPSNMPDTGPQKKCLSSWQVIAIWALGFSAICILCVVTSAVRDKRTQERMTHWRSLQEYNFDGRIGMTALGLRNLNFLREHTGQWLVFSDLLAALPPNDRKYCEPQPEMHRFHQPSQIAVWVDPDPDKMKTKCVMTDCVVCERTPSAKVFH